LEGFTIELEQVARAAMEGQTTPRLATQADRRIALDSAEDSRPVAHTRSSSLTMVWPARDNLGLPPLAFVLVLPRAAAGCDANRASWSWALVHDLRYVTPRRSHSCWSSVLLIPSIDRADEAVARSPPDSSSSSSSSRPS